MRWLAACLIATSQWACGQPAASISISLASDTASVVRVTGLSSAELASIRSAAFDDARWRALLTVRVAGGSSDAPPVAGKYSVTASAVEFTPRFPLDPGRDYGVRFDPARLPVPRPGPPVSSSVSIHAEAPAGLPTTVARMRPSAERLPENLLRVYLEFSAPMSREDGRDYLELLDERGQEVKDAFLALDVDFWSPDHRRYTVFFDPGRVKRGILPNDQLGRALRSGHQYSLVVDPHWRDASGRPLGAPFVRAIQAGPADMSPIRPADWRIEPPAAGTRSPVVVTFPKPLDYGLLQRALGIAKTGARPLTGTIAAERDEREWRFTPDQPWVAGAYELIALSILEDPAGNRIGRPFDIDTFDRIDSSAVPAETRVPFVIR